MRRLFAIALWVWGVGTTDSLAQLPVEWLFGKDRSSVDIQFFRNIRTSEGKATPWLFFNRNRVTFDETSRSFGFTQAFSYNRASFNGFAPVAVFQVLNTGLFTKAGVQYAGIKPTGVLFSWLVLEAVTKPDIDLFVMYRNGAPVPSRRSLFVQIEAISTVPTDPDKPMMFVQRGRLGVQMAGLQIGIGLDASQIGRSNLTSTFNPGGFLRYDFRP